MNDPIRPNYYNSHPSGVKPIDIGEHLPSNLAQAIYYVWRAKFKENEVQDLKKAIWYLEREQRRYNLFCSQPLETYHKVVVGLFQNVVDHEKTDTLLRKIAKESISFFREGSDIVLYKDYLTALLTHTRTGLRIAENPTT